MDVPDNVRDFLATVKKLKASEELLAILKGANNDHDLIQSLVDILQDNHCSLISDNVCETLFTAFIKGHQDGVLFCMQFVPALLWAYYNVQSRKVSWNSTKIETVLLAIYNKVVLNNIEAPHTNYFRVPSASKPSIYHEPYSTLGGGNHTLTENALSQYEKSDTPIILAGPTKYLDRIPAGFRSLVTKTVLQQYNTYLSSHSPPSLTAMCNCVLRLSSCGHPVTASEYKHISQTDLTLLTKYPKINFNSDVMKEMIVSLQFILYNGFHEDVVAVLKSLHAKTRYALSSAGLLNSNALLNLIELSTKLEDDQFHLCPPVNPLKIAYRGRAKIPKTAMPRHRPSYTSPKVVSPTFPSPTMLSPTSPTSPASSSSAERITLNFDSKDVTMETPTKTKTGESQELKQSKKENFVINNKLFHEIDGTENDFDCVTTDTSDFDRVTTDATDGKDSTALKSIETELLEISTNTDKTPLINVTSENSDASQLDISEVTLIINLSNSSTPLKTFDNVEDSSSEISSSREETKM